MRTSKQRSFMQIGNLITGLLLTGLFAGCLSTGRSGKKIPEKPVRQLYAYESEGIGYSDIQVLYSNDSNRMKSAFFKRPSLQNFSVSVKCQIRKTLIHHQDSNRLYAIEILEPALRIENDGIPFGAGPLAGELQRPAFLSLGPRGNITGIKTDTGISHTSADILKDILGDLQFIQAGAPGSSWETEEENATGIFLAGYHFLEKKGDSLLYEKKNLGYSRFKGATRGEKIITEVSSRIHADSSGMLLDLTLSASQVIQFNGDTVVANGTRKKISLLSLSLSDEKSVKELLALEEEPPYLRFTQLSAALTDAEITRLAYKGTLGGDNVETLLEELKIIGAQSEENQSELVKKFRAFAYLNPGKCADLGKILLQAPMGSPDYKIISQALSSTETPAAINALADVLSKRMTEEALCMDLLPILATTRYPTDYAVIVLKQLLQTPGLTEAVRSTAELALGGMAYHLRSIQTNKADDLSRWLFERVRNHSDTLQRLLVIGNTGSPEAMPILRSYIKDPGYSPGIRQSAVSSLRLIRIPEAETLLQELAKGRDSSLAKKAREALEFRREYADQRYQ